MSEKKTVQMGLRITDEAKEQYEEFCNAHNCTKGDGLELLLQFRKMKEAESENPKRAENLASFRHHMEVYQLKLSAANS